MRDMDKKDGELSLELRADSGYRSSTSYRLSPNQWRDVLRVLEGKLSSPQPSNNVDGIV
jgi:hypothetical protein